MKTKEVADICGVTEECIRQNAKKVGMEFGYGEFTNHDWTEDELKSIQLQLMKNAVSAGGQKTESSIVKQQNQSTLELGALTIAATQSVEATQQLCKVLMQKAQQFEALQIEQQKNQLLIEQKEALQKEVDKYVNWKSASEIKSEFKLPYRPGIEKVALLLKLRENEDWITKSYDDEHVWKKILYSPEAVDRIVEYFTGE
jgi:nitric oxide reductase large subunit